MVSILTSYDNVPAGDRKVYIRMFGVERKDLESLKQEFAQVRRCKLLYIVDHRENQREIFC